MTDSGRNLMGQGQAYTEDASTHPSQGLSIFAAWLYMSAFWRCQGGTPRPSYSPTPAGFTQQIFLITSVADSRGQNRQFYPVAKARFLSNTTIYTTSLSSESGRDLKTIKKLREIFFIFIYYIFRMSHSIVLNPASYIQHSQNTKIVSPYLL